ncbi:hypothetical protein [Selenomonas ruminantium]|uniref:Uncharacterized protein n=1 Tax=Selenomonas ruminantium TaxID=971 RepID=A0A1H3Z9U5_SELRU|nr:hypothetical protein [Selenomonas ruminantium]SEA20405.1 hypothetical protein SAMN05660648_02359 [Selenomonas ruminantium]
MAFTWTDDIYLKLLDDLMDKHLTESDINAPILRYYNQMNNSCGEDINNRLNVSCNTLKNILNANEMYVGEQHGYVEPCPISYTGKIITGSDKFYTVFIGLNPHLDLLKEFPEKTTLIDLANLHHPDDVIYDRKEYVEDNKFLYTNNYWRVFGNMEGKTGWSAWSSYYRTVIRVHLAFIDEYKEVRLNTWSALRNDKKFNLSTDKMLDIVRKYPLANVEIIPYKSRNYAMKNFSMLFNDSWDDEYRNIKEKYKRYFYDIWKFLDDYATDNAYIFIPTNYNDGKNNLKDVYDVLSNELKIIGGDIRGEEFVFAIKDGDDKGELIKKSKCKGSYLKTSPMYLCEWINNKGGNRKIIITASLSGRGKYNWIYNNFDYGWIDALKKYYGQS